MKVKKVFLGLGVVATMFILAANLQYAIGDYGILTSSSLHSEILAQSTTGTGTGICVDEVITTINGGKWIILCNRISDPDSAKTKMYCTVVFPDSVCGYFLM